MIKSEWACGHVRGRSEKGRWRIGRKRRIDTRGTTYEKKRGAEAPALRETNVRDDENDTNYGMYAVMIRNPSIIIYNVSMCRQCALTLIHTCAFACRL
jgi:hypothetical protein